MLSDASGFLQTDLPRQKMYLCKIEYTLFLKFSFNIVYIGCWSVWWCLVVLGFFVCLFICLGFFLFRDGRKKWLKWNQPTLPLYHHFLGKNLAFMRTVVHPLPSVFLILWCSCNDEYSLLGMFGFETKLMLFLDYFLHKVLAAWHWVPNLDWLWISVASGEVTFIFLKYEKYILYLNWLR